MKKTNSMYRVCNNSQFSDYEVSKLIRKFGYKEPLNPEREAELVSTMLNGGLAANDAKWMLIQSVLPAVFAAVKKQCPAKEQQENYFCNAIAVLLEKACNFDPTKGCFLNWATNQAYYSALDFRNAGNKLVKTRSKLYSYIMLFRKMEEPMEFPLSAEEFAEMTGCGIDLAYDVEIAVHGGSENVVSIDDSENPIELSSYDSFDVDGDAVIKICNKFLDSVLTPTEQEIWRHRKGLVDGYVWSFADLADRFGQKSADSVRKLMERADKKLRSLAMARLGYLRDEVYGLAA